MKGCFVNILPFRSSLLLSCLQLHSTDGSLVTFTFAHHGPARAAVSFRQKVHQCWDLVSNCGQKWMPGERAKEPVDSCFPHIASSYSVGFLPLKLVSLPSLGMLFPPVTCRSQILTSCYVSVMPSPPPKRRLCSSASLLCKVQLISHLEMQLTGGVHTTAISVIFYSFAQSERKELQMPQLF